LCQELADHNEITSLASRYFSANAAMLATGR